MLAHQLTAGALRPGAAPPLWGDLAAGLDMLGGGAGAGEPPDNRATSATHAPVEGPTVLGADDAVAALEGALDWGRLCRPLPPGAARYPGRGLAPRGWCTGCWGSSTGNCVSRAAALYAHRHVHKAKGVLPCLGARV